MARQKVVVTGIRAIDKKLRALPYRIQGKVVRPAMRKGLKLMAAQVKAEAPVETGATRANVVVRAVKKRRRGAIAMEARVEANDETRRTSAKTGEQVFYPATVQFGREGVEPDPFMSRAFAAKAEVSRQVTIRDLEMGVEREASR